MKKILLSHPDQSMQRGLEMSAGKMCAAWKMSVVTAPGKPLEISAPLVSEGGVGLEQIFSQEIIDRFRDDGYVIEEIP